MRATGDTDVNDLTRAQSLQSGHIVFRLSAPHANGAEPVFNRVNGVHKLHCVLMQSSYASCECIFAIFVCIFATSVYIFATCVFTLCAGERRFMCGLRRVCPASRTVFIPCRRARQGMTKAAPTDECGGSRRARVIARSGGCAGLLISVERKGISVLYFQHIHLIEGVAAGHDRPV